MVRHLKKVLLTVLEVLIVLAFVTGIGYIGYTIGLSQGTAIGENNILKNHNFPTGDQIQNLYEATR